MSVTFKNSMLTDQPESSMKQSGSHLGAILPLLQGICQCLGTPWWGDYWQVEERDASKILPCMGQSLTTENHLA